MHIDGSHINILSQVQQEQLKGLDRANLHGPANGAPAVSAHDISETFAQEIVRRIDPSFDKNGQPKDSRKLVEGLTQAMDYVRERHGDEMAQAAMGMVLQSTSGGVTEESLSNGLVNVLKMIDRNAGIAAGDAAIARFNGALNQALNEHFDNGLDEKFIAGDADLGAGLRQLKAKTAQEAAANATTETGESAMKALLDSITEDLEKELAEQMPEDLEAVAKARMQKALGSYAAVPDTTAQLLNAAV